MPIFRPSRPEGGENFFLFRSSKRTSKTELNETQMSYDRHDFHSKGTGITAINRKEKFIRHFFYVSQLKIENTVLM